MRNLLLDILLLYILPSLVASFIHKRLIRPARFRDIWPQYAMVVWIGVAMMKVMLGKGNRTVFESFESNGIRTFTHWLGPVLLIAVLVPVAVKIIYTRYSAILEFLQGFTYVSFTVFSVLFMVMGYMTNIMVFIGTAISFIIQICLTLLKVSAYKRTDRQVSVTQITQCLAIFGLWGVSSYLFIPIRLYLVNQSEFQVSYGHVLAALIFATVFIVLFFTAVNVMFIPKIFTNILLTVVFALTFMGYVQENFLNGVLLHMDGRVQEWTAAVKIVNVAIWIAICLIILGTGVVCACIKKNINGFLRIISIVAACLSFMQLFAIGYLSVTTPKEDTFYQLTDEGIFDLGDEDNIVVFILDWYDEQVLDAIVEEQPDFLKPLDGFTWYRNQTSRYAFTHMSIPYLLTDVRWQEGMTEEEYTDMAFDQGTFLKDLADMGYDIGLYTEHAVVRDNAGIVTNYERSSGYCDIYRTIKVMSKCSRYEMMPFCLKQRFYYTGRDISEIVKFSNDYYLYNQSFYRHFMDEGLNMDQKNGKTFKFYHVNGCHDRDTDEELRFKPSDIYSCGKGVFKIVFAYMDELKRIGLYDNTTVIITADHGQNYLVWPDSREKCRLYKNTSNPILLIKERGSRGEVGISDAPVSHDDFFASIMEYAGGNRDGYGRTYGEIGETEERHREMDFYWTGVVPYKRYHINGMATDPDSWSEE